MAGSYCHPDGTCHAPDDGGADGGLDGGPMCQSSAGCTADTLPICDSQTQMCRACTSGDDQECMSHNAATPRCISGGGVCVACRADTQQSDCTTAAPICDATTNTCRACKAHGECASGVCNGGSCVAATAVAYVDISNAGCSDTPHVSTQLTPYCPIQMAITSSGKTYIVVAGSGTSYGALTIPSGTVTLIGPGGSATTPAKIVPAATGPGILVQTTNTPADVTVDGFDITGLGSTGPAVKCSVGVAAASLTVRNSYLHNAGAAGLDSTSCTVIADANIIAANQGGGVSFAGTTNYTATNNIIAGNGSGLATSAGVVIANGATGTFAFNTVVKNTVSAGVGGIDCGTGAAKAILHSIAWANTTTGGTQLGAQCTLTNVVTAAGDDNRGSMDAVAPQFVSTSDFHLKTSAQAASNAVCCIDKIAADPGTPNKDHDVDNTARPKNSAWDIGAHEVQ